MRQRIFLIDGFGALLSTLLLVIVSFYEEVFGMPSAVIRQFIFIPSVFIIYSFSIYFLNPVKWKLFLRLIATANLLYCLLTLGLVIRFSSQLTPLGLAYFIGEIFIIVILSIFEFRISRTIKE